MIARLLNFSYRRAVCARLGGEGQGLEVPPGGQLERHFLRALFVAMGRLAKLDGLVCEDEVQFASRTMTILGLDPARRQQAIDYFYHGKHAEADALETVRAAVSYLGAGSALARLFLKTLCRLAFSKGAIRLKEKILLRDVAEVLGFHKGELLRLYTEIQVVDIPPRPRSPGSLGEAYRLLELPSNADDRQIRRAYRRLMARYHPDKLAGSEFSAEALRQSQDKFVAIRNAYETISGFRSRLFMNNPGSG